MPTYRIGIGSELNLKDRKVGVGSETPVAELDVSGTLKHKNSIKIIKLIICNNFIFIC